MVAPAAASGPPPAGPAPPLVENPCIAARLGLKLPRGWGAVPVGGLAARVGS